MTIETFYPQLERLKPYIAYYYFIKTDSPDFKTAWYSFPHVYNAVSIYKQVGCEVQKEKVRIIESKAEAYVTMVQAKCQEPLLVQMQGRIQRVSIIFKSLGFNNFIRQPLSQVINEISQRLTAWENIDFYPGFLEHLFELVNSNEQRITLLEDFLLSQYQPFFQMQLTQALELLSDFEKDYSVEAIADRLEISVRTFNRLFNLHLGISPIGYKRIARFRHSLNNKLFSRQFKRLTEIGYESNFYDQSYFIKMYNKLTGFNPSVFFDSVQKLADNNLILKFIKE